MCSTGIGEKGANSDRLIPFDVFKGFQMKVMRTTFDKLDTNGDNAIDQSEWNTFLRVHNVDKTMRSCLQTLYRRVD